MKVQRISAATPTSTVATLQKTQNQHTKDAKVTNPNVDNSSKASQIIRNYFIGSQMVNPAFTGFACSTANFKVKELEDMPCTCCGRPMMTNAQIDEFVSEASNSSGYTLNNCLNKNMDYFRAEEKAVVHYIQKQLKRMPDASLSTAISRTEPNPERVLKDEQIDVLQKTNHKSQELFGQKNPIQYACEYELLTKFNVPSKLIGQLPRGSKYAKFDRTGFLTQITRLEKKHNLEHEKVHELMDIATQLPESENAISKMLNTAMNGNERKLAQRLIQKAVVTAEHIHPKSKGGPNATNNYMGECQECNSSRGNMSYDEWMKKYPNMPDNIQENLNAVTEEIIKGKIGGNYDDYPLDLKEAIFNETNGKVVLKIKNPEEIDAIRKERGSAKPIKDLKERNNASGEYQGSYHGFHDYNKPSEKKETTDANTTEVKHTKKSKKKRHGGKIKRFPESANNSEKTSKVEEQQSGNNDLAA